MKQMNNYLEITNKCNQNCIYCFQKCYKRPITDISISETVNFGIRCVENNISDILVTGGEPFAHNNVLEIINTLYQYVHSISILTNGFRIPHILKTSPSTIKRLKAVQISLDSTDKYLNDRRRGYNGATHDAVEAIKLLTRNNINVVISSVYDYDINELSSVRCFASQLGLKIIHRKNLLTTAIPVSQEQLPVEFINDNYQYLEQRVFNISIS